ncbi:beta-galactosidase [Streptomyces tateyamensis]|uniref:Beta-galactosidase n=1 Tax=Streptomyces tateyamensis TaxID=565073 RepID=A0A2V4MYN3_9ACTN|nr:beta-galactosidase [Streptomyces tateyamensis]PYC69039.1 beta-galactosidase [Streptomyces tateyamensis]
MDRRRFLSLSLITAATTALAGPADAVSAQAAGGRFTFTADGSGFLLDGAPFQIRSGELHPARIPVEYWQHRIRMAKAMGLNTVSVYVMWNYVEESPGVFDFTTDRRDIVAFLKLCQQEGMWALLRGGPYVCGEWDLGGIPPYLLQYPDIKLRVKSADDPHYMAAVTRYFHQLVPLIRPLMIDNGGPVLMVQVENEYGSYGSDAAYLEEVRQLWLTNGVNGPFYTQDGLGQVAANHTVVTGGAIGLSGGDASSIAQARKDYPAVPAMAGEVYPGWLTHWGDSTFQGQGADISATLRGLMAGGLSFNLYMLHGGTSFGFTAGANADDQSGNYQPDITSYDYGAPVTEQGRATDAYTRYRTLIAGYLTSPPPAVPDPVPTLTRAGGLDLLPSRYASLWDNLPAPLPAVQTVNPQPMESYGQNSGLILYSRQLTGFTGGPLAVRWVHDYATVFLDGHYAGGLYRQNLPASVTGPLNIATANAPLALTAAGSTTPQLDILVEGLGRTNYGHALVDRKGILESVTVNGSAPLTGWRTTLLPLDATFVAGLRAVVTDPHRPGIFFRAQVRLDTVADTYLDLSNWTKGVVWVNGRNLGRYWHLGPQQRLYCPAPWLKAGLNEILILDLHQTDPLPITLQATLAGPAVSSPAISPAGWRLVYADSQETAGENGAAANAFDGNAATIWHTQWYALNAPLPHEIQLDLGARYAVDSFSYLPRQDGSANGRIGRYELYIADSTSAWGTPVATGTLPDTASRTTLTLPTTAGRYLRLRALTEAGNRGPWTSAAELGITGVPA